MDNNQKMILEIAEQLIWWQPPEQTIQDHKRLITQILEYSTPKSVAIMFEYFSRDEIIDALRNPLPGIMSPKSWRFWRLYLGLPEAPLPKRQFIANQEQPF